MGRGRMRLDAGSGHHVGRVENAAADFKEILRRDPAGTTFVVGGFSNDATSWITRVELDTATGTGFTQTTGTSPWSYAWQLPADGNYVLTARSYDYVGNLSAITNTTVLVDGTPPTATLNVPGNLYVRPSLTGTILLSGTASDNLAGLSFIEILLALRGSREAVGDFFPASFDGGDNARPNELHHHPGHGKKYQALNDQCDSDVHLATSRPTRPKTDWNRSATSR